jgi:hypothetical protein
VKGWIWGVPGLRRAGTIRVMLVEKTDRLYRNLKDWVTMDDMDVEMHFPKEGVVLSRESRSSEKFMHGIKVLMAELYRQPVRGSPQGHAGKGRAGHLADQNAARLSQHHRPGRQEDHRWSTQLSHPSWPNCSTGTPAAAFR